MTIDSYTWEVSMQNINNLVGKRIKQLRSETGLSQEKFALKIGMDRSYFAAIEVGKRNITLKSLQKILAGLEISFEDFFKGI